MVTSTELLHISAADLRRITAEARLLLVDRPTPEDVEELRGLRVDLVADLARFQNVVHRLLIEAAGGDACQLRDAIDLKVGAIALGRAYVEFRERWLERHFADNWAEYRLSALRMIHIIHVAIAPVDRLSPIGIADADRHVVYGLGVLDNNITRRRHLIESESDFPNAPHDDNSVLVR